jgi:glycosyltransferase involved in cell wall biosynthesis
MKILMVLEGEFPPDNRVEKEAVALIEAGHEVHIACYSKKKGFASREEYKNIVIHRKYLNSFLYKAGAAILILPFYFSFWKNFIEELFQLKTFDAIHIHDLPLAKTGYHFKRKYGTLLVCDQHEFYSNWIVQTAHYNTLPGKLIKALSNWDSYEKRYLQKADVVVTVEEPLRKNYIEKTHLPPGKIFCIPNTPLRSLFNKDQVNQKIVGKYRDNFVLLYIGGLDVLRGIEVAIKALPHLIPDIPEIRLVLVGGKSRYYDLEKIASAENVREYVDFTGFQSVNLLPSYIEASSVCFFTPLTNRDEIHKTIATKIYQYIAMGKPVIVTDARMQEEFVRDNKIGFVIRDGDSGEFAERVLEIYKNKDLYTELCENALRTSDLYTWESTVKPLVHFYNSNENIKQSD